MENELIWKHYEGDGGFTYQGKHWTNATLYDATKRLKPFNIPLRGIRMDYQPWGLGNVQSFCYHVKRVEDADMKYPIILTPDGTIADGWHRIAKAILEDRKNIKAVRLLVMPEPDEIKTE